IGESNNSQLSIEMVHLKKADPLYIVNTLNGFLNRIVFAPNTIAPKTATGVGVFGAAGAAGGFGAAGGIGGGFGAGGGGAGAIPDVQQDAPAPSGVRIPLAPIRPMMIATNKAHTAEVKKDMWETKDDNAEDRTQ